MDPSLSTSSSKLNRLKHVFIFLLILLVIDYGVGLYLNKEHKKLDRGEQGLLNKIFYTAKEEVLVFGSSRAKFHYDSLVIEKETGKSCYNAGLNGRGFLLSSVLIKQLLQRHKPEVIILDINFLGNVYQDESKKLDLLRPYYSEFSEVKDLLDFKAPYEKIKHLSSSYPYNLTIPAIIERDMDKGGEDQMKGSSKLKGTILKKPLADESVSKKELDKELLAELFEVADICVAKNVKLLVCISPVLERFNASSIQKIRLGLEAKEVEFHDFSSDDMFKSPKIFYDLQHLNDFGSIVYSQKVASLIKGALD